MAPSINEIFDKIKAGVEADPSLVKKVREIRKQKKKCLNESRSGYSDDFFCVATF